MKHTCHWPGCKRAVPPKLWGCGEHWAMLPQKIKSRIWAAYVAGQEISKTPSAAYLQAAAEADRWIRENFAGQVKDHDPGRWARLVRWVKERDASRAARRAVDAKEQASDPPAAATRPHLYLVKDPVE